MRQNKWPLSTEPHPGTYIQIILRPYGKKNVDSLLEADPCMPSNSHIGSHPGVLLLTAMIIVQSKNKTPTDYCDNYAFPWQMMASHRLANFTEATEAGILNSSKGALIQRNKKKIQVEFSKAQGFPLTLPPLESVVGALPLIPVRDKPVLSTFKIYLWNT